MKTVKTWFLESDEEKRERLGLPKKPHPNSIRGQIEKQIAENKEHTDAPKAATA